MVRHDEVCGVWCDMMRHGGTWWGMVRHGGAWPGTLRIQ
jgi:hypothetical protein